MGLLFAGTVNHRPLPSTALTGRRDREPPEALAKAWGAWPPSSTPRASVSIARPAVTRLQRQGRVVGPAIAVDVVVADELRGRGDLAEVVAAPGPRGSDG